MTVVFGGFIEKNNQEGRINNLDVWYYDSTVAMSDGEDRGIHYSDYHVGYRIYKFTDILKYNLIFSFLAYNFFMNSLFL